MEVLLPALFVNYDKLTDRQTTQPINQQTDMRVQREVIIQIMIKFWEEKNKNYRNLIALQTFKKS